MIRAVYTRYKKRGYDMSKIRSLRNAVRRHITKGYLEVLSVRNNATGAAIAMLSNDDGYVDTAMKIVMGVVGGLALLAIIIAIISATGTSAKTQIANGFNYTGS